MIGFTTTIPLELLLAGGHTAIDLNNIFISDPAPHTLVDRAEQDGFPRNCCNWIKGIYGTALREGIDEMIAVSEGDCSNTKALMEVLQLKGVNTYHFAYPSDRSEIALQRELDRMAKHFGAEPAATKQAWNRLNQLRTKVQEIDRLTWETNQVSGAENHLYQVCTSDMDGDPDRYEGALDTFLDEARSRSALPQILRLAYIGVPPICTDLYQTLEKLGARVVFNEVQRQFSMALGGETLVEQYRRYTYPYDINSRLDDIETEIKRRRIDGVIHYVQSFCYRQIEDIVVRDRLKLPILTLEGDQPGPLDARNHIRIESFIELLKARV